MIGRRALIAGAAAIPLAMAARAQNRRPLLGELIDALQVFKVTRKAMMISPRSRLR